jgi:outer membrane protein TolC
MALAACLGAQVLPASTPAADPAPASLAVDEAVAAGLARDPGVQSAAWDLASAKAKLDDARLRMLPSLVLSSGYTQLNEEPSASPSSTGSPLTDGIINALLKQFSGAPSNSKDLRLDLQYPVFAGFRLREASEIAKSLSLGKEASAELAKRALTFDIRRSYWEAVRAQANVGTLAKALELEGVARSEIESLAAQGMATTADQLAEQARYDQATLALDDAQSMRDLAMLVLASLEGDANAASTGNASPNYELTSKPGEKVPAVLSAGADEATLVGKALANRPETRAAAAALGIGVHAKKMAEADFYPTLLLTGSLSYADPDPRIFPPADKWNLSWSAGLRLRFDLGSLPGALARGKAASSDLEKARADLARTSNGIALDVRKCVLSLKRAKNSLELTRGMVGQAAENRRVAEEKLQNGMAKRSELLQAEIALLRANLAVESRLIDVEIAEADLLRAAALE